MKRSVEISTIDEQYRVVGATFQAWGRTWKVVDIVHGNDGQTWVVLEN